jgi:hypothetical protein
MQHGSRGRKLASKFWLEDIIEGNAIAWIGASHPFQISWILAGMCRFEMSHESVVSVWTSWTSGLPDARPFERRNAMTVRYVSQTARLEVAERMVWSVVREKLIVIQPIKIVRRFRKCFSIGGTRSTGGRWRVVWWYAKLFENCSFPIIQF